MQAYTQGVSDPAIREQLHRIVGSKVFRASERMGRLLRFVVEWTLEGRGEELKEYLLGVEVFDRTSSFDPRLDPIVRVEARRLRAKLRSYYDTEGSSDGIIIDIPTGCYVPRFQARDSVTAAPAPGRSLNCIAVLPFANLSPEPDTDYFSDGLTEELIHALTKVDGLRVVAWDSAAKMKDRQDDLAEIGRRLMVGSVLRGSVRRAGERIRITVSLVATDGGSYLWSETYDRMLQDLFAIQEDISRLIADSLRVKLLGAAKKEHREWNLSVYDLYLRGRHQWNKRSPDGFRRAIQFFSDAVAMDPHFAPGYAGLADAYSLLADHGLSSPLDTMPQAKAAALKALEIDPDLAEAHASLALITSLHEWRWTEAGLHYRKAMEINPGYATARHWYAGDYLALLGRFEEAIEEMKLAVKLDPLSPAINESLAYVYMLARRYDDALECHLQTLEMEDQFYKTFTAMGRLYLQKQMYGQAIEMLERGRALMGDLPTLLGALAQAHGLNGDRQEARALLDRLSNLSTERFVPHTAFAFGHLGLGEREAALDHLEQACARRELGACNINVHPGYDVLRAEPRFVVLLRRIGFAN